MSGIVHARLPEGGRFERWTVPDGWAIRTARWPGERGTLLVANGRGDFIEKYGEAIRHWHGRGWSVLAFDWRGQGGSGRVGRSALHGATPGFARKVADLRGLIGQAAAEGPGPLIAAGHSMGGHLILRALAEGEGRLARVVLNAPMLGIRTPGVRPAAAGAMARVAALAAPGAFGPGQRAGLANAAEEDRRRRALTGCAERGAEEYALMRANPDLAVGGVTWGWLSEAYRSIALLARPGVLERIGTPVRFVLAGGERVTDNGAAIRAVARLRHADYRLIEGGAHELWRERDGPRLAAFAAADEWLERE